MPASRGRTKDPDLNEPRIARRRRAVEAAVGALLAAYFVYVLILAKFFSPAIDPSAFRDLGILWDMSDYVLAHGHYEIGINYFPPATAILVRLFGLIGRELAYRVYLLLQIAALVATLWAWCRLTGLARRPQRMLIVLVAVLVAGYYLHFEFHMHNLNLVTLALVSLALVSERSAGSGAGYALAVALKPYGSVLVLPWMIWHGRLRFAASAILWLAAFFVVLPVVWFGPGGALQLSREWIVSLIAGAQTAHDQHLSVRNGIAMLIGTPMADPLVARLHLAATAFYLLALVAFFVPTLLRRRAVAATETAAEVAAMLLAPLPLGGLQQPARASVLVVATLTMAAAAFDGRRAPRARVSLAALLAAIGVSSYTVPLGPLHFLLTLPLCLMALAGLAIARAAPKEEGVIPPIERRSEAQAP
jgi:hypothetical protein